MQTVVPRMHFYSVLVLVVSNPARYDDSRASTEAATNLRGRRRPWMRFMSLPLGANLDVSGLFLGRTYVPKRLSRGRRPRGCLALRTYPPDARIRDSLEGTYNRAGGRRSRFLWGSYKRPPFRCRRPTTADRSPRQEDRGDPAGGLGSLRTAPARTMWRRQGPHRACFGAIGWCPRPCRQ